MNSVPLQKLKDRGYLVFQNISGEFILYYKSSVIHKDKDEVAFLDFIEKYEKGLEENESLPTEDER